MYVECATKHKMMSTESSKRQYTSVQFGLQLFLLDTLIVYFGL